MKVNIILSSNFNKSLKRLLCPAHFLKPKLLIGQDVTGLTTQQIFKVYNELKLLEITILL